MKNILDVKTFCSAFFIFILTIHQTSPSEILLLQPADVRIIIKILQTLEFELNTNCIFISWIEKWEIFYQFVLHPDLHSQSFMNFNNDTGKNGKIFLSGSKYASSCELVVYSFGGRNSLRSFFYIKQNHLGTTQRGYHVLISFEDIVTSNDKLLFGPHPSELILMKPTTTQYRGVVWFDLDFDGNSRPFEKHQDIRFRNRWNFHEKPLIWAVRSGLPFWNKDLIEKFRENIASEIFLATVMTFSKVFNATPAVLPHFEGEWDPPNQKFGGRYDALVSGLVHVAVWMALTLEGFELSHPSIVAINDGLAFFTGLDKRVTVTNPLSFLIMGLDPIIWTFKICCLLVTVAFILGTEQLRGNNPIDGWSSILGHGLSLLASLFRLVAQQDFTHQLDKLLQMGNIKLVIGPWLLCLIILNSDLQTRLSSSMTIPEMIIPPKTFDQLIDSNYKINFIGINGSTAGLALMAMIKRNQSQALKLQSKFEKHYSFTDQVSCLKTIKQGENVCMGQIQVAQLFARWTLMSPFGQQLFQVSTEKLTSTGEVLFQSKRFPHLFKRLNFALCGYLESGIFNKWAEGENFMKVGRLSAKAKLKEKLKQNESKDEDNDVDEDEEVDNDADEVTGEKEAPIKSILIVLIGNGFGLIVFFWESRVTIFGFMLL